MRVYHRGGWSRFVMVTTGILKVQQLACKNTSQPFNVQFLCERYGMCRQDLLNGINKIVDRHVGRDTDPLSLIHAQLVYELVMVRDGVFSLCDQKFTNKC